MTQRRLYIHLNPNNFFYICVCKNPEAIIYNSPSELWDHELFVKTVFGLFFCDKQNDTKGNQTYRL